MTKKQILFLIAITILGSAALVFFGAWRMRPFNSAEYLLPTNTSVLLVEGKAPNHSSSDLNQSGNDAQNPVIWPTVTPRTVSQVTPTPTGIDYQQIIVSDVEIQVTATYIENTSEEYTKTPTSTPTITATINSIDLSSRRFEDQSPFSIGNSVQGEELLMYKFGNGPDEKLIVAGIHGGYEYNTSDLANELIAFIDANSDIIPGDITLYILPSLNPDGLDRSFGYAGRANANNVDLNRNWDFNWKNTWDPTGCWAYLPIFGGNSPFSEPETAALRDFIHSHNLTAILSYHSAALGVFPGGMPEMDLSVNLAEAIAQVVPYPYPPIQTGCEFTGQFVDYAASYGIPALDIELTNHKDSDFDINLEVLKVFLSWSP